MGPAGTGALVPQPRRPAPGLAGGCRFPLPVRPPARERPGGGEEEQAAARRDRGPGRRPSTRPLTCQLSSQ